jgi:hypothetical protein
LGNVKKYPYLINQNHIFFKKYESWTNPKYNKLLI